jgi:solute carrier family 10 (sodium/bile acid cotransporter), member 7
MKIDRFLLAIIIVIAISWFFPFWGSKESPLPVDIIGTIGISLIFFFYGLKLSPEKVKSGLKNWRLHILVQLSTFVFFPIIVLAFYPLMQSDNAWIIWLSFMFLAALPSTVSSSVVMVSIARGNVPGAIFNASISGLIGIVVTPLWMGIFLQQAEGDFQLSSVYLKLITEILAPVALGILLQKYWGKFALKNSRQLSTFDKSVILLIIWKSFSDSFLNNVFSSVKIADLLLISLATIMLFYLIFHLTGFLSQKLNFNFQDRVTARFCGTKKSLVHGTVFASILIPATIPAGIILLPLMLFHTFQILIISFIAARLAKEDHTPA